VKLLGTLVLWLTNSEEDDDDEEDDSE